MIRGRRAKVTVDANFNHQSHGSRTGAGSVSRRLPDDAALWFA